MSRGEDGRSDGDIESQAAQTGPLNYTIDVGILPKKGHPIAFKALDEDREALIAFYGLASLEDFRFDAKVFRWRARGARAEGTIRATLGQFCVVTGEPVTETVEEPFEALFLPSDSRLTKPPRQPENELVIDVEAEDPPEIFEGKLINLGALEC